MITPEIIDAMVESGCTAEQLAAVIKADLKQRESKAQQRREIDRERKRKSRTEVSVHDVTRNPPDSSDSEIKEKEKSLTKKEKETPTPKENPPTGVKRKGSPPGKRGTRLEADWQLPEDWGDWALQQGVVTDQVLLEEEKFRDYWLARAGPQGVKRDWFATWRNWIRRRLEDGK